jgi:hypothetical protein
VGKKEGESMSALTKRELEIERQMRSRGMTEAEEIDWATVERNAAAFDEAYDEWWNAMSDSERAAIVIDDACGSVLASMERTTECRLILPDVMVPF